MKSSSKALAGSSSASSLESIHGLVSPILPCFSRTTRISTTAHCPRRAHITTKQLPISSIKRVQRRLEGAGDQMGAILSSLRSVVSVARGPAVRAGPLGIRSASQRVSCAARPHLQSRGTVQVSLSSVVGTPSTLLYQAGSREEVVLWKQEVCHPKFSTMPSFGSRQTCFPHELPIQGQGKSCKPYTAYRCETGVHMWRSPKVLRSPDADQRVRRSLWGNFGKDLNHRPRFGHAKGSGSELSSCPAFVVTVSFQPTSPKRFGGRCQIF